MQLRNVGRKERGNWCSGASYGDRLVAGFRKGFDQPHEKALCAAEFLAANNVKSLNFYCQEKGIEAAILPTSLTQRQWRVPPCRSLTLVKRMRLGVGNLRIPATRSEANPEAKNQQDNLRKTDLPCFIDSASNERAHAQNRALTPTNSRLPAAGSKYRWLPSFTITDPA
ncbi:hypothetical protein GCM10027343_29340 [Noviherbaspirillum agri]